MKEKLSKFNKTLNKPEEHMVKIDYIIIGIITLLYTILSFINLGSLNNPQTFYKFEENEEISLKLSSENNVYNMKIFNGDVAGNFEIYTSTDNTTYNYATTFTGSGAFAWNNIEIYKPLISIKIVSMTANASIGEIALYNEKNEKINIIENDGEEIIKKRLYDEQNAVPEKISYLNTSYFDEIYFARTAYDYKEKIEAFEWTHPPLGKLIQAIPVILFNKMAPFYYRLMGNIAGIIMIYVMYLLGKIIFKTRKWAIFSSLLMFFDTFHFAHTRMGTIDSFLVLFIMTSIYFMIRHVTKKNTKYNLVLSGLFFGLSVCVKWTGMLGGLVLAIIYFMDFVKEKKSLKKVVLEGFIFFVIIPLILYIISYLIYPNNQVTYTNSIKNIILHTKQAYMYHSRLEEGHIFSSKWYTWPISYKPVWYYTSTSYNNIRSTISGIGNIVIWWLGLISIPYIAIRSLIKKEKTSIIITISILGLWLPSLFIGRVMFLYHYFPVLPFMMLAVTSLIKDIEEKTNFKYISIIYLALVVLFFIIYYPIVSGMPVSENYIDSLKLFKSWCF